MTTSRIFDGELDEDSALEKSPEHRLVRALSSSRMGQEVESELVEHVAQSLFKHERNLKKCRSLQDMDPFSLKTRIEMFKGDHLKLDKAEVDPKSTRLSDQQKFDDYQRRFKFKMNMLHVQTQVAHQVMHLSFV